ncbi:MAG: ABC transporter ATP-binding protein [Acidobacteriota bacterium]
MSTGSESNDLLFLENTSVAYGDLVILHDIDLRMQKGEFCTVVGPSGCGKSTLLRLVLGQQRATSGRLLLNGHPLGRADPTRGIVFQHYSLFPHLTVLQNVIQGHVLPGLPFFLRGAKRRRVEAEAMAYLDEAGIADQAKKYPHQLSGGQKQRAAIIQAILTHPDIVLMDEPFSALDPGTREDMQQLLLRLWIEHDLTVLFVTHDLEEAVFLGTRLIALSKYYSDGRSASPDQHGARIVVDLMLRERNLLPDATIKSEAKFAKLIEQIKNQAFDPEAFQHVLTHDLSHPDAYFTLDDIQARQPS